MTASYILKNTIKRLQEKKHTKITTLMILAMHTMVTYNASIKKQAKLRSVYHKRT